LRCLFVLRRLRCNSAAMPGMDTPARSSNATSSTSDRGDSGLAIAPLLALMRWKQPPWLGIVGCDVARWLL